MGKNFELDEHTKSLLQSLSQTREPVYPKVLKLPRSTKSALVKRGILGRTGSGRLFLTELGERKIAPAAIEKPLFHIGSGLMADGTPSYRAGQFESSHWAIDLLERAKPIFDRHQRKLPRLPRSR